MAKGKTVTIQVTGTHQILRIAVDGWSVLHVDGKQRLKLEPGKHELRWQARTKVGTIYGASAKQGTVTLAERKDLEAKRVDDVGLLRFTVAE